MTKLTYNWYILVTRSGQEKKIIEKIWSELDRKKRELKDYVHDLQTIINANDVKLLKGGYIVCYCHLTPELVRFFYSRQRFPEILSFLAHQRKDEKLPSFVSEVTIKKLFSKIKEKKDDKLISQDSNLNVGDLVKIATGTFANYEGRVAHLDKNKQKAKIIIESSGWEITDVPVDSCQKILI